MDLVILECIRKSDNVREGEILAEFLSLPYEDDKDDDITVKLKEFTDKSDFLKYLGRRSNLENFSFVHLSGHGMIDDDGTAYFDVPRGRVQPYEFPEDCFSDMHVGISACELGKVAFVDPFIETTSPISVLGPIKEVPFRDACLFWINYYSHVLHQNFTPKTSHRKTMDYLRGKITGGFKFHETV
jgi:hypothetical protein